MTRDEAKEKLMAETVNECSERFMNDFLDSAVALGMLKLDKPASVADLIMQADFWTAPGAVIEVSPSVMAEAVNLIGELKSALKQK